MARIKFKRPNGKWGTLYRNLSERKAKDIMKDIVKNMQTEGAVYQEGDIVSGIFHGKKREYRIE